MEAILGNNCPWGRILYLDLNSRSWCSCSWSRGKKVVTGKDTYFGPPQVKFVDEKLEGTDIVFKK